MTANGDRVLSLSEQLTALDRRLGRIEQLDEDLYERMQAKKAAEALR